MKKYKYIIIGGGMTADAAVTGIRDLDSINSILMVSSETNPPYNRPPLSKGLWKGKPLNTIWRNTNEKNINILLNHSIISIDPRKKTLHDNQGDDYQYDKLLLATGGKKRILPFDNKDVIYYRTIEDYKKLRALTEIKQHFGVIGTGFIGSEISAALAMAEKDVTVFDIGSGIGWNIFPPGLTSFLNDYFKEKKIRILPNLKVNQIRKKNDQYVISDASGISVAVDAVIAGVGIEPDLSLAKDTQLKIENGIVVDKYLQTSDADIYAGGDVANFYNPILGKRIRIEHADNANAMGRQAGRNIAGARETYNYLPYFYSDLFDLGYEAVGLLDSRLEIIEDWSEKYKKGVLYYIDEERVSGVLLWNVWDKLDEARKIIGLPAPIRKNELIGKIT